MLIFILQNLDLQNIAKNTLKPLSLIILSCPNQTQAEIILLKLSGPDLI